MLFPSDQDRTICQMCIVFEQPEIGEHDGQSDIEDTATAAETTNEAEKRLEERR